MCEPTTLAIIGTAVSAYGSIAQGSAQAQAAEANAAAAERNANNARWQANQVEDKKAREMSELHWQRQQTLAKQRVAMAAYAAEPSAHAVKVWLERNCGVKIPIVTIAPQAPVPARTLPPPTTPGSAPATTSAP